jgi:hypothetical protein
MNKKILTLALIPAALFLACTADGLFSEAPGPGKGGGGNGSCTYMGTCTDGIPQDACIALGGSFSSGKCSGGNPPGGGGSTGSCTISFLGETIYCEEDVSQSECNEIASQLGIGSPSFVNNGTCPYGW